MPTDETNDATVSPLSLLPADEIEAVSEAMRLEKAAPPDHYDDEDFAVLDGILDGLAWLRGERPTCPVVGTGPVTPETAAEAVVELEALIEALPPHDRRGAYAGGTVEVLAWALGKSSGPPSVY